MRTSYMPTRKRGRALGVAVAVAVFAFPALAEAERPVKPSKPTVMTRNLYLGAVLDPAIAAPTAADAFTAVGEIYEHMEDMNFNARAKLLANEIEATNPDLIGLQEVSHWFRDEVVDGSTTQATETVYDYLHQLQSELRERGLNYTVAVSQNEADLEFPADTTGDGNPEFDARLLMRDVILAREGVKILGTGSANYPINASVPTDAFGTVTVKRGYTYADVRINKPRARGTKFRFINTHLESFSAAVRTFQAGNLTSASEITDTGMPTVLVGDLNSDPDSADAADGAYEAVVADGFADLGVEVDTCCFGEDLRDDPPAAFTSRIDHVMGKGLVSELSSALIGTDPANRTGTELWPTDHGGVVSKLKVG